MRRLRLTDIFIINYTIHFVKSEKYFSSFCPQDESQNAMDGVLCGNNDLKLYYNKLFKPFYEKMAVKPPIE